jgi:hypothetical protein
LCRPWVGATCFLRSKIAHPVGAVFAFLAGAENDKQSRRGVIEMSRLIVFDSSTIGLSLGDGDFQFLEPFLPASAVWGGVVSGGEASVGDDHFGPFVV